MMVAGVVNDVDGLSDVFFAHHEMRAQDGGAAVLPYRSANGASL
jgi:hypothetical protein